MSDYRISDFGASADDVTDNRSHIQAAIDACHAAGGGRVIIPAGICLSGSIELLDYVELHLERARYCG